MPHVGRNSVQAISIIDKELYKRLRAEAKRQDITFSHLMRRILTEYDSKKKLK